MAAPTVVGVGAVSAAAGAITPAFPTELLEVNDILIGVGECNGTQTFPSAATNGFAHVTGSPVTQDSQTTLTVIWARYDGVVTAHSWGDSGNHNIARTIAVRGCVSAGNPWDVVATAVESTANNSAEWPIPVDTTVADTLVLLAIATGRDLSTTANLGAVTATGLTSLTERMDNWTNLQQGGGIGLVTGEKAAAGSWPASITATMGSTDTKAYMTLALRSEPVGDTPIPGDPTPLWRKARAVIVG